MLAPVVGRARVLPIRLHEGSVGHRVYVVVPWVLALGSVAYVPFAHRIGFAPGSIDQPFRIEQLNQVIAFAVAILGLNLVVGFSGQLSLGQSAFVGLGAYTTVILVADHGWSIFATLPVAAAVCLAVGLLVGLPASRITGPYLAVATLAMAYVFPALVLKYGSLTGGVNGKGPARGAVEMSPPSWAPFADAGRLAEPLWVYCILVVLASALFLLARNFVRSRPGRALRAVRDNVASAPSCGIDPMVYKAMAFAASAVYGGLAGAMLMINRPFATDGQFGTRVGIFLLVGVVIGGSGSIAGAVPGALAYFFVPYYVTGWTDDPSGMPPGLRQLATPLFEWLRPAGATIASFFFGLALLVLVFLLPGGVADGARRLRSRFVQVVPRPRWLADVGPPDAVDPAAPAGGSRSTAATRGPPRGSTAPPP
jgi:branched-chain amino acid transport system permease protein